MVDGAPEVGNPTIALRRPAGRPERRRPRRDARQRGAQALRGHAPAQRLAADEGLHPLIAREPAAPDDVEVELRCGRTTRTSRSPSIRHTAAPSIRRIRTMRGKSPVSSSIMSGWYRARARRSSLTMRSARLSSSRSGNASNARAKRRKRPAPETPGDLSDPDRHPEPRRRPCGSEIDDRPENVVAPDQDEAAARESAIPIGLGLVRFHSPTMVSAEATAMSGASAGGATANSSPRHAERRGGAPVARSKRRTTAWSAAC